jgi:hypothetical protein
MRKGLSALWTASCSQKQKEQSQLGAMTLLRKLNGLIHTTRYRERSLMASRYQAPGCFCEGILTGLCQRRDTAELVHHCEASKMP